MSKIIGLAGAHRTGKTTLCQALGEAWNTPFIPSSMSEVLKKLGVDPQKDMPFKDRIGVQLHLMAALESMLLKASHEHDDTGFLTDRTPLDIMAYTYSEILRESIVDQKTHYLVSRLMEKGVSLANRFFDGIIIVPGGIPLVHDPDKAPAVFHYQEHISALIRGLAWHPGLRNTIFQLPMNALSIRDRVDACSSLHDAIMSVSSDVRGGYDMHSTHIH